MAEYGAHLKNLLAPLGIYDLRDGTLNESELFAQATGLDDISVRLEYIEREALTGTAEGEGLHRREELFARRPAANTVALRRRAIAALMQIDADSFSLDAINRTISGCGIKALAQEMGGGHIRVIFPDVGGIPEEFPQIQKIVLDIIPCHLETEFYFRYMLWSECEDYGWTWDAVEAAAHTWHSFELAV
ncbi:hypothetical protein SDC9_82755 [bioreactor metagenome]|uniref:DUF2313 domain-containing protein n=1 Tax=bioreactor metagenome TaxID=1076179 RepID=A0A644Z5R9_9ZZZZ